MLAFLAFMAASVTSNPLPGSVPGAAVIKEWHFRTNADTEGRPARHDLADFTAADGALQMTIAGGDPYFHAPPYEFDGLRAHIIEVRARLPEAAKWSRMQLFFGTPDQPQHSPQRQLSSAKTEREGVVVFLVDLHEHEQARGPVRNVRLDIHGAAASSIARIDSIRILRPPARLHTQLSTSRELVRSGDRVDVKLRVQNAGGEDAPRIECSLETGATMQRTDAHGEAKLALPALAPREAYEATLRYRVLAQDAPAYVRLAPPADGPMPPAMTDPVSTSPTFIMQNRSSAAPCKMLAE